MHAGRKHLNQRFPRCPDPACSRCGAKIKSIGVIKQETVGQNTTLTCRANCTCGQRHLGHRVIGIAGKHMQFRSQTFDPLPRVPRFVVPATAAAVLAAAAGLVWYLV